MLRSLCAAAALLLLGAGRLHAQTPDSLATDTVPAEEVRAPVVPRGPNPFSVETSGRPTPLRVQGEVVWAGSERAPRATSQAASADSATADTAESAPPPRRAARSDSTTTRRTARADSTARRTTRPDSTARRTARADSTAARRTARADSATRRTARADTATRRDTATARRATAATGTRPRTHTVARGESLAGIARRYGVTTAQIRALNPGVSAEDLETGMTLRLPAAARAPGARAATATERPASATSTTARAASNTRRRSHTVESGETLYGIARRYGVTVDALRRANDIESDVVRPGQTLVVPPAS